MVPRINLSKQSTSINSSPVRGRPFEHGNSGRPPGSKNKVTRFLEQLVENEGEELTRKLIDLAKEGKLQPLLYCMNQLIPQRCGRALEMHLPRINGVNDISLAIAAITDGLNNGSLTREEASHLSGLLEALGRAIKVNELAVRLEKVEAQLAQMKTLNG
jgi:hypothetical protein